jgi:hypothetical protein
MKIYQIILFGLLTCLATQANSADWAPSPTGGTVNCRDAGASINDPVAWSYVIKTTGSLRLGSDILYNDGTNVNIISSFNVAQYEASKKRLLMVIDDISEIVDLVFEAKNPTDGGIKSFNAELQDFSDGEVISTRKLTCLIIL